MKEVAFIGMVIESIGKSSTIGNVDMWLFFVGVWIVVFLVYLSIK